MQINGSKIFTIFLSDISQRLRTTEELRESRRALSTLLSNLPGMAYRARDKAGRWSMEFASEGALELCGYTPEQLTKDQPEIFFRLIHPKDVDRVDQEIRQAILSKQPYRTVYRISGTSGKEKWVWEQGRLISPYENGESLLEGFITDITERREAERKVEHQYKRLKTLRVMDMAITKLLDLQSILNTLVEQIQAQMQVDAAMVLLFTQAHRLEYAAGIGFHLPESQTFQCALGEGLIGHAALIRRQLSCLDASEAQQVLPIPAIFAGEGFVDCIAVPLEAKNELKGMLVIFHRSPISVNTEWSEFLDALSDQAAIAIDNATLYEQSRRSNTELMMAYEETIEGWASALELRDQETEGHSRRVVGLTLALAQAAGVPEEELVHIRRGAILHDIGKMGIPDSILQKPGPLSPEEWEKMRQHPVYAFRLLSAIPFLRPALDIPFSHHERWDGSGYPRGLKGTQIPLAARIFTVVDVWDALRSQRPYRGALPDDQVIQYLISKSGKEFDPEIIAHFTALLAKEPPSGN
jgi:PAS domain S-box-containing protein